MKNRVTLAPDDVFLKKVTRGVGRPRGAQLVFTRASVHEQRAGSGHIEDKGPLVADAKPKSTAVERRLIFLFALVSHIFLSFSLSLGGCLRVTQYFSHHHCSVPCDYTLGTAVQVDDLFATQVCADKGADMANWHPVQLHACRYEHIL